MASAQSNPAQAAVEERKEKLVEKLSVHYSLNKISIEEYERLMKYSQEIETPRELQILESLIEGHAEVKNDYVNTASTRADSQAVTGDNPDNFTLLSSRKTTGVITSGNYTAILGDHKIVIEESDLINDETVLNCTVFLGNINIQVPDNVKVVCKALPILGDVSISDNVNKKSGKKCLVITGNVLLGNINIKSKKPQSILSAIFSSLF